MTLEKDFIKIDKNYEILTAQKEKEIALAYKKSLEQLRYEIGKLYEKYEVNGKLTFNEMNKFERLDNLEKLFETAMAETYVQNKAITTNLLRTTYNNSFTATKGAMENEVKKKIRAILKPVDVTKTINTEMAGLKWVDRLGKRRIDVIYNLQMNIRAGLTEGMSYSQMANNIKETLGKDVPNAQRIARTESKRVFATAQTDILDKASNQGVEMTKTWHAVGDERTRPEHMEMDGITIPYNEMFTFPNGVKTFAPGQSGTTEDIQCRCFMTINVIN